MRQRYCTSVLVLLFALIAVISASAQPATSEPYDAVVKRLDATTRLDIPEWRFHPDTLPHPELATASEIASWSVVKPKANLPTNRGWICREIEIPRTIGGFDITGYKVQLDVSTWADDRKQRVYINGNSVAYFDWDTQPVTLSESAHPGDKFYVAISISSKMDTVYFSSSTLTFEPPAGTIGPEVLRDEIVANAALVAVAPGDRATHQRELDAAVAAIDIAAIDSGNQREFVASLEKAQQLLQPLNTWMKKTYTIKAIGNAHMDMAWLWPWTETVEVTRNTYSTVLQLMRQYPQFVYAQSQVRTFEWMEEKYPAIFKEIQQRVKEGRWELVGGMWVEPDLNMPDGESFVRQLLVGKRYFRDKFGVDVRIGWNPDSFGYNWQLPQIYKRAGIDYFITQKMAWSDTTQFPHKLFWWQSPDGSKLLTYFPHDYVNDLEPRHLAKMNAEYTTKTHTPEMLWLYGVGDHGGGPTRDMLDTGVRWQDPKLAFPNLQFSTVQSFFNDIEKQMPSLAVPTWNGELYLQKHRGVTTTQSLIKRWNRKNEVLMLTTEKFASLASLSGSPYPQRQLNEAWKKVLFNQFHDILPGSSIHAVYIDADREHQEVARSAREVLNGATARIEEQIDTRGPGAPVVLFNPLSWERTDMVEIEARLPQDTQNVAVTDASGKALPAQYLGRNKVGDRARIRVLATVPSMGYTVLHAAAAPPAGQATVKKSLVSVNTLENEFLRVTVDPKSGCITSLYNKAANYEAIDKGGCGNLLQTFVDKPKEYDAWDIDVTIADKSWNLDTADEVKVVEDTPTRAAIRVTRHFQKSIFVQDITLDAGVPRVDVRNSIEWNEKHILLKAAFPLAARNNMATYEIPYGNIQRPTTRNTAEEKAMFEVPALRWADLSDSKGGFSLLNESKYGYDAKDNVLRLSLLRGPEYPDPHPTDEGHNEFTYSLYPHGGDWKQAGTVRRGYELNYPLVVVSAYPHEGALPQQQSFVKVDAKNVVLSSIKKAEDDNSLVIRLFEFEGKSGDVQITLPRAATAATEVNLMEDTVAPLGLNSDKWPVVVVPIKPYEIKSVKVGFLPAHAQ